MNRNPGEEGGWVDENSGEERGWVDENPGDEVKGEVVMGYDINDPLVREEDRMAERVGEGIWEYGEGREKGERLFSAMLAPVPPVASLCEERWTIMVRKRYIYNTENQKGDLVIKSVCFTSPLPVQLEKRKKVVHIAPSTPCLLWQVGQRYRAHGAVLRTR